MNNLLMKYRRLREKAMRERQNQFHKRTYIGRGVLFFLCLLCFAVIGSRTIQAKTVTKAVTIGKGKTYRMGVAFSRRAEYQVSNKKVVSVKNGTITGKAAGTVKVTVKDKGNSYVYKVTVSKAWLSKQSLTLKEGKSAVLKVKGSKGKVTWSSSNKKVASVNSQGKVTARKQGKAVITAKVKKTTLKCSVTVTSDKKNASRKPDAVEKKPGDGAELEKTPADAQAGEEPSVPETPVEAEPYFFNTGTREKLDIGGQIVWGYEFQGFAQFILAGGRFDSERPNNNEIAWKSSDEKVAVISFDSGGYAYISKGTKSGKATITAAYRGKEYSFEVVSYVQEEAQGSETETVPEDTMAGWEPYLVIWETGKIVANGEQMTWGFDDEPWIEMGIMEMYCNEYGGSWTEFPPRGEVVWKSSDEEVVEVVTDRYMGDSRAYVRKGIKGGKATVTASYKGKEYSFDVVSYKQSNHIWPLHEGTGFYYEELLDSIDPDGRMGIIEPLQWSRTDLLKKNILKEGTFPNGSDTFYTVEGTGGPEGGETVITGMSADGYTRSVLKVYSNGDYAEKKGVYDEKLTNELYDVLKLDKTRDFSAEQVEFLLNLADRWYNGEISTRYFNQTAYHTPFDNSQERAEDMYGEIHYFGGSGVKMVTLSNVKTAEEIAWGITRQWGFRSLDGKDDWTWDRSLLYLKVHVDGDNVYVYICQ